VSYFAKLKAFDSEAVVLRVYKTDEFGVSCIGRYSMTMEEAPASIMALMSVHDFDRILFDDNEITPIFWDTCMNAYLEEKEHES